MRFAAQIEYDGNQYSGWQRQQAGVDSIQLRLETALSKFSNENITVICAGRTDSGVHALGQVVHFDSQASRKMKSWMPGVNYFLPTDIRLVWIGEVADDFHARFSALERTYRYAIFNRCISPAILSRYYTWEKNPLDENVMHQAGQLLLGERDFSAFRASACQSNTPWRHVSRLTVTRADLIVSIEITANAFLYHMVRNIAGVLIEVGKGRQSVDWVQAVLASKDRKQASVTAPPSGLTFMNVNYPEHYGIAKNE
jgi:tRNA pseudouridine38-40 synthase